VAVGCILALVALLGLRAAGLASAAGLHFQVNSTADVLDANVGDGVCRTSAGACTLRAAIQEANAIAGADLIMVPAGTYALEIPPLNQNLDDNGDLDITDSLTITGAGASATIVDGGTPMAGAPPRVRGLDRLFEVLAVDGTVAFSGLTFGDGYASEYGGAIMNNSTASVTVAASTFTGNVADKVGGAIDNHLGGAVHVQDSTLSNNVSFESGSALNNNRDGTLSVANSTILSNSAADIGLDESLVGAGAIANNAELDARGTITVAGSQVIDNAAGGSRVGAALSNDGAGTVVVDHTTFSKNRSELDGGAIFNGAGEVTVTGSTFSENAGENGGAIFNSAKDGRMNVSDSTFSLNSAAARGGAIANGGTGSLTVAGSTFLKNSAQGWGGGVVNDDKGSVAIANSTFRENAGLNGGGLANEGDGLVTVENSTFTKNSAFVTSVLASGEGGGMQTNSSGDVVITDSAFTENTARDGGGFGNEGGGHVTITGTRFSANTAEEKGGGILIQSGTVRMLDIDVIGNFADAAIEAGGGIAYEGDKLVSVGEAAAIENSRIRDNKAKGQGGGIDSRGDGPLDIVTTSITGNSAAMGGGIHHVGDAPLDVTRSTLSGNFAESGGGLFTDGDGETGVENTTVSGNRAGQFGGGLLVSSRLRIRSSTVAGNNAASGGGINNGGGDLVGDGNVFLLNTIVANNLTGGNCQGTMTSLGGNLESGDTCQFRELSDQPGTDPRLGPLADNGGPTQTHALLADSPAQETAVCTELAPCPPVDQRGMARPIFIGSDIGAYESDLTPGDGGDQPCTGRTERPVLSDFDSWINETAHGANFGTDSILKAKSLPGANHRALVHFTLPTVPPGCRLVGATLRLYSSASTEGRTLEALRVASDWSEFGVTWENQPETAGSAAKAQSGHEFREWDVLEQTRDMYAFGDHGFLIRDAAENESGEQSFHSTEKGIDRPPELVLIFDDPNAPPPPIVCPTTPQSLAADRDSWVSEGSPLNNFGNDSTLKVKSQAGSQIGNNARTLVRFPLPPLPAGCTSIASATLRLDAQSATPDRTLEALQIAIDWGETEVTWSNQPATTGAAVAIPSGEGTLEWPVTAQILDMYVSANRGFLIRDAEENGVGAEQTFNGRLKLNDGPPELVLVFDDSTPETTIDSGPASPTNDTAAAFGFSSDRDDATFECSLDGAEFRACDSPHSVSGLAEGSHKLAVRSTRKVRAVDPTPASYDWIVDLTAPDAAIESGPADPTNETSAELSFAGSDNVDGPSELRFECRLDHPVSDWGDCASPVGYHGLGEGQRSFEVRAVDRAGNAGAPAAHGWSIDLTAPETSIDSGPADPSNSSTAELVFSASEESAFVCSLDGGPFESCSSPAPYEGLAEGRHSLEVRATDRAGNADPVPAVYRWTIDLTPPETAVDSGPADPTNTTSASIAFSAADATSFECRLDGADFSLCKSPQHFANLAEGGHAFDVRAIDAAGNVEPIPARYSWTVDLTAPETAIDSGPADPTNSTSASFSFSANEEASFECSLDGGPFGACAAAYEGLGEGGHGFAVRATDRAGNVDENPAVYAWTIDLTAPETAIDSGPSDPSNSSSAEFVFSADEEASFECSLDGPPFAACPASYEGLGEGGHILEVRAIDRAGNADPVPAVYRWTIDLTQPETVIDSGPADPTNRTSASLSFSAVDALSFECRLDGADFAPCESPHQHAGLAEGGHAFDVRAIDAAGNVDPNPARHSWTIDLTPPETSIDSGPADPTNGTAASFAFSAGEAATFECRLDGGEFGPCESPAKYELLAEGRHSFDVRATDAAGNVEAVAARAEWTIDLTPPETVIDSGPADPTNSTAATFAFSADEDATFECSLDAAPFDACSAAQAYEGLGEGDHIVEVRAVDRAGNVDPQPAPYGWTIDLTPPEASIGARPDDRTNSTSARFEFSAGEEASFECSRDGGAFAACSSPQSYEGLGEGAHTFDVRAIDRAGNVDSTPARAVWTIDLTPPETSIDEQPADPTSSTSARFVFSASEGSSFECRLDGGDFGTCESPASYDGLAEGRHSFDVRATDAAGNVEAVAALAEWTVDVTPPETAIDSGPADPSNSATAAFAFSANEEATFACSLDGGSFESCSSSQSYGGLAEGAHSLEVRAIDRAGNVDANPAVHRWAIDLAEPETTIDAGPAERTNSTAAIFEFSADEEASFECSLDGRAFEGCASPQSYEGLGEGAHAFDVRAIDRAGNIDSIPARAVWTIDLTAPETSIDDRPSDPTSSSSATFAFSADEQATFACSLDGAPFAACSSPRSYDALGEGRHTFEVRAVDAVGNVQATPAGHAWTVDQTAPQTSISAAPPDPTNSTAATFAFSSSDEPGSGFACSLDGGAFAACGSPAEYRGLEPGTHTFQVRARDAAGNSDPSAASYTWTIDLASPDTQIDAQPADPTNATSASFAFSSGEPGSSFECRLDGEAFASCGSPQGYEGLGEGAHTFDVRAIDRAGNVDSTPARVIWTIDVTAPEATIDSGPAATTTSTSASFSFSASEPGSTFECSLDGGAFAGCTSPSDYSGLADGRHEFRVRATDAAANAGTPAIQAWTIEPPPDTTEPETTIDSGPRALTSSTSASFSFSSSKPSSTFECSLDGAAFAGCVSPREYAGLANGTHQFSVRATDGAGNVDQTAAVYSWTIDNVAPETTISDGPAAVTASTSASFSFSASETGSAFQCSLDGAAFASCSSPQTYAGLADGAHQFRVRATDAAGNADATPATATWTIDTLAPETTISAGPSAVTASTNASFSFSANESGSTFECSLDGGAFLACSSPRQYAGLADSAHQFRVRAVDAAGNVDGTPAQHGWTIDTVAPETTIDSAPPATTTSTSASFSFSASESASTFECSLDGAAFAVCTSPRQYTGLGSGSHQFRVRARDAAGNLDGSPAAHSWTISAPAPTCTSPVTLAAAADAWIDENSPSTNKGTDSILKVQSKGPRDNFRALVRFPLPAVPEDCVVDTATLRLYAASMKPGRSLQALRLEASWVENGVSWSNQPGTTGAAALTDSGFGYREWNVTAQVRAMLAEGASHGFLIRDAVENGDAEQQFHSREKGESTPQLVVRFAAGGP
jgi:CSLREA domain-containing protein